VLGNQEMIALTRASEIDYAGYPKPPGFLFVDGGGGSIIRSNPCGQKRHDAATFYFSLQNPRKYFSVASVSRLRRHKALEESKTPKPCLKYINHAGDLAPRRHCAFVYEFPDWIDSHETA